MEVCIGKVIRTKGLKGHIVVYFFIDRLRPSEGDILFFEKQNHKFGPYQVELINQYKVIEEDKKYYLLKLKEINSIEEALLIKSYFLIKQIDELPENIYLREDLLESKVFILDGKELGQVRDIIRVKKDYILLIVETLTKEEIFIPFIKEIVNRVDKLNKVILLNKVDGVIPESL